MIIHKHNPDTSTGFCLLADGITRGGAEQSVVEGASPWHARGSFEALEHGDGAPSNQLLCPSFSYASAANINPGFHLLTSTTFHLQISTSYFIYHIHTQCHSHSSPDSHTQSNQVTDIGTSGVAREE